MISSGPFHPAANFPLAHGESDNWLVPGIVPRDSLVVLASAPKTGKTCFATALARAVAKGEPFLGHPVAQSTVLWCAHEETPIERMPLHEGLTLDDPLLVAYPGSLPALPTRLPRTDRFGRRDLRAFDEPFIFGHAVEVGAKLIVIDCLHAAVEGAPLADNAVARAVMGTLRTWSFHFHVSVLVLHHLTKSGTRGHQPERFADSAQILAASSCHFFMDREEETATRSRIVLYGKGRHPAPYARLELISEGILDYRLAKADHTYTQAKRLTVEDRVLSLLAEGWSLTSEEIARRLAIHPGTVRHVVARLISAGSIATTRTPKSRTRYTLSEAPEALAA